VDVAKKLPIIDRKHCDISHARNNAMSVEGRCISKPHKGYEKFERNYASNAVGSVFLPISG